jgi:hypothetical protein
MQYDCRPQNDADRLGPESSGRKHKRYNEVVDNHRGDQSSRGRALRIIAREPARDADRKQPSAPDACHDACRRLL